MPSALLQLDGVAKSFGAARALKGVSFDLRPGEVHALLGENGAGKSTLIKIITGALQPDEGEIIIRGEAVRHLNPAVAHQLGIACIYQQPALFPDLTVAENIGLRLEPPTRWRRVRWNERRRRALELLERSGAAIHPDALAGALPMPEQQLVEIACAIGAGAQIVIMDEPTASLTQREQRLLFQVVRQLRDAGVGVIYISHRLEEIFLLADRVTVLRDGESLGAAAVDAVSEAALIQRMVGREVSQIFPPGEGAPGREMLSLKDVGCAASGIHGVTLNARAGEIVGLAGLVGAGRTELARVLFGLTPADSGEIRIEGRIVRIRSPREAMAHGVAYLPEDRRRHGVILEMPAGANIALAIHRRIFPGGWLRFGVEKKRALDYMRRLDVRGPGPEAAVNRFSGGNQQKVALARWLAAEPKILILDEPTQGVDVGAKSEIHKIIRNLAKEGLAALLISSDLPEIIGMSDRTVVMRGGTVAAELPGRSAAAEIMAAALGQRRERASAARA